MTSTTSTTSSSSSSSSSSTSSGSLSQSQFSSMYGSTTYCFLCRTFDHKIELCGKALFCHVCSKIGHTIESCAHAQIQFLEALTEKLKSEVKIATQPPASLPSSLPPTMQTAKSDDCKHEFSYNRDPSKKFCKKCGFIEKCKPNGHSFVLVKDELKCENCGMIKQLI